MLVAALLVACKKDEPTTPGTPVAPSIAMRSPEAGSFVPAGTTLVAGSATGLGGVRVNGVATTQVGSTFQAEVDLPRGVDLVEVSGTDPDGHEWFERRSVIAGEFAEAEGPILDALVLRLNHAGIDQVAELAAGLVSPTELSANFDPYTPVYNVYFDSVWPLDDTDVNVFLNVISFEPLRLDHRTADERLHVDLRLPTVYVELETWGTIPLLNNTEGDLIVLSADELHVAADVAMDVGPGGAVTASLENVVVDMPGFEITWDYLWDAVEWVGELFLDLQTLVEDTLVGVLSDVVPGLLEDVFGALNTSFDLDLLGKQVALRLQLDEISADPDGIAFLAHLAIDVPSELVREEGGWLTSGGSAAPSPDRNAPASVALSDDFLNRALYELWASNLLDLTLSTDDGSIDPLMLAPLGAVGSGSISVQAGLPPAVVERDGRFVAQLGEIGLHLETPGGQQGNFLDVVMHAEAPLDLSIVDNEIHLAVSEPALAFAVVDSDWGASNETITRLLEEELPIDLLVLLLGDLSFPLPELPGLSIARAEASRDPSGVHTDIELSLR